MYRRNTMAPSFNMTDIMPNMPILEPRGNATNGTDSSTVLSIGIGGYIPAKDLWITIGVVLGLLVVGSAIGGCWFARYRKRKDKEIERASNLQVNISRPAK